MTQDANPQPIEILLVEDNPGDARLTAEALKESKVRNRLQIVSTGEEALQFLRKEGDYARVQRPGLILLDLNLPGKSGRDVLAEIKTDDMLKSIPVIVLTTSREEEDILKSYKLHANCFISKPVDGNEFIKIVHVLENYWFHIVQLPPQEQA